MTGAQTDALLAGPRGRRLLHDLDERLRLAGQQVSPAALDPLDVVDALADSVAWARYWQEPDEVDQRLALPGAVEQLRALAPVVLASPVAAWWTDPIDLAAQVQVQRVDDPEVSATPAAELLGPAADALGRWRAGAVREEEQAARERPVDVHARHSGRWWSTPAMAGVLSTVPVVRGVPVLLEEDSFGQQHAWVRSTAVDPTARVLEIGGPDDWARLVADHPLPVTSSRRHDWWRATGWDGAWALPDWPSVAQQWDGVHVSVLGYVSTAGVAVEVGGGVRTLLAGWDPGRTWWLTDVVTGLGDPVLWSSYSLDDPLSWHPAGDP